MLTLTNLLPEMIRGIASHLPDIDHTRLRITCKTLYAKVGEARKLGEEDYWAWHEWYESYHRRTTYANLRLLCTCCMNFLSRADFQDSKSHKACSGKRVCVECAIVHELYDNTSFVWGGINKFWCFGCHVIQPVLNDEGIPNEGFYVYERAQALRNAQRTGTRPVHVDTQEHKWCRPCWETIKMFEIAQRNLAGKVRARREKRRDARREKRRALAALAAANAAAVVAAVATSVQ